jgi:hypothetical protein
MSKHYDIIGDIHGQYGKLINLLARLGYKPHGASFRHPEGRKVLFLGDYVDRGPNIGDVLRTVRAMVESGDAVAIMGNHELNAIFYHTPDGNGGHLRTRNAKNTHQHGDTLAQFANSPEEWAQWVEWMKGLPFFLELDGFRAVHACWHDPAVERVRGCSLLHRETLIEAGRRGSELYEAVNLLLKGPELELPPGATFIDNDGVERTNIRVRWWQLDQAKTLGELIMPAPQNQLRKTADRALLAHVPDYPADAPPVFFGHYWLSPTGPSQTFPANATCLDYSAGRKGPLTAYRWDGPGPFEVERLVLHSDAEI